MTTKIDHSQRAHARLSPSSAERWLACPPSAVAADAYPRQDTDFTREGTLAHEVAEQVARQGIAEKCPGVTAEMLEHAREYADYIKEHTPSESAIVLLEQRVDISPWVPDCFGTCDCIIIADGKLTVIDYKYGQGVPVSAVGNPQLRLYALGALNDYGFVYDVDTVETHIFQPRVDNVSFETITADELTAWGEEVKPKAAKAAKGEGEYKPGSHCKFCPHAGRCRALTAVCSEYVNAHGLRVNLPVLAPHEVAEVLQMEPLVNLWLKRVHDQALTSMLNGQQIPGYKVVEGRPGNRKWTDDMQVLQVLTEAGYEPGDVTETKLLSPAAMEKAIGKKKAAELLSAHVERAAGSPTIAPESDKRKPFDRLAEAQNDFND